MPELINGNDVETRLITQPVAMVEWNGLKAAS
jgi:hypothetical protein